jgi:transposase InsO family protein
MLVRVLFCFVAYPGLAAQFGPGDGYDVIARNLVAGNGYVMDGVSAAAERLPLYPLLLALSVMLFGDAAWPWQLAQCLCGAVTCGLVLVTARRYARRGDALAAAALCAVHPTLILYTARPMTETAYVLLVVLFVVALTASPLRPRSAGGLWGAQLLLKSTAGVHLVAILPLVVRYGRRAAVAIVLPAVLVLAPWVVWNVWTFGTPHLFSARGGITLYHGIYISQHVSWTHPTGDLNQEAELTLWHALEQRGVSRNAGIVERDAAAGQIARQWITTHPAEALRLWLRNLLLTWYLTRSPLSMLVHFVLHAVLLLAASVGTIRLWRRQPAARDLVVVAVSLIGVYTALHAVVQPAVRYILPVVPVAALLAAGASAKRQS